jgi:CRISPR-associated protein Cas1
VQIGIFLCVISTPQGKFLARVSGKTKGNVLLRQQQYAASQDETVSLEIAKNCIVGKIHNARWVLERALRDHRMQIDEERVKAASDFMKIR